MGSIRNQSLCRRGTPGQTVHSRSAILQWLAGSLAVLGCLVAGAQAQTVFLDFNTPGQYDNNFNVWNDVGGSNGGNYAFNQAVDVGVGSSGGVNVFQSTDTTATYQGESWDFSTNGAALVLSVMIHANGQSSGNKIQLGIMNVNHNGLNNNSGVAFESFRFIPSGATTWTLREQYRSGGSLIENQLGSVPITVGHWYRFVVGLTNTAGATGNYSASCALYDFGTDGLTPGANLVTFPTLRTETGQTDVTTTAVWPALRAFQDAGVAAWDNFLVYTSHSPPVFTQPLTNTTVTAGTSVEFNVLANGPGSIDYAWFTNGVPVTGLSGTTYTPPALTGADTNVTVVASNANGAVTNSATINVVTPTPATIANLPASDVQATFATLRGQVLATGHAVPTVTLYYGLEDGGTNAAAWGHTLGLGSQTGTFAQTVGDLTSNTTYYFTAKAVNSAGTAWATPSQSFMTAATNTIAGAVAVLTQHNDNNRSGDNLQETQLNIQNVNTNQFGLLYTRPVDDQIYAQPLVMTNVVIPGQGPHNIVIVATVNDSVYAYDADNPSVTKPYWTDSFINPPNVVAPRNTDMTGACGGNYKDFSGNIGIVSTPVIDPATRTLYVLARTKENGTQFVQRLHALDVTTGAERPNSPVVVTATYPGGGAGSVGGLIPFDSQKENQRAGLTLANGIVYITWSSHCDWGPYHGWVIGYNAATLQQAYTYVDTPNGDEAGIWMSGQAPAADAEGNIYLSTGNGTVDAVDHGESFLKLSPVGNTLQVASWFTPYNWQSLNSSDADLGCAGILLVPGTSLAISGGKQGELYVVNRDQMGGLSNGNANTNIVQSWSLNSSQIHGTPVWWTDPNGSYIYIWPQSGNHLRQYQFINGRFITVPYAVGATTGGSGSPGGILSISADGTNTESGILWAVVNTTGNANQSVVTGTLHAYSAANVSTELWNSDMTPGDTLGNLAKFVPPTVANGKVYMATFSNRLDVYGLFPRPVLSARLANGEVLLSWPATTPTDYTLQTTTDLTSGNWTTATNAVSTANGAFQVTIPLADPQRFYRLAK